VTSRGSSTTRSTRDSSPGGLVGVPDGVPAAPPEQPRDRPPDEPREQLPGMPSGAPPDGRIRVLLVEDDEADAFLVGELLDEVGAPVDLAVVRSLAATRGRLGGVDCVLLDLGLPDAQGLDALRRLLRESSAAAVCVLTGLENEQLGAEAVAVGAQDYLIKGQVTGTLLARAVRYAVERKRADENARRLREVELRQAESARLERGLLPQPLMRTDAVRVHACYRPGRHSALLGGDFYDVVQTGPDRLHLLVGDVSGHGAEEAALGVELRVAWRTLILAGVDPDRILLALEQVLVSERHQEDIFATVATVSVDLGAGSATVRLAGHPPPLLLSRDGAAPVPAGYGPVLGIVECGKPRRASSVPLPGSGDWALLMYTDGLIEGRVNGGESRLELAGLCQLLRDPSAVDLADLPDWLVEQAEAANGGPLPDDVAMLLLSPAGPTGAAE
jgi:serine phosphatase RsbU (regulator of sigma subunit)